MADKPAKWALVTLDGAEAEGAEVGFYLGTQGLRIPISQMTMTYGKNEIPTATAIIAMGRNARSLVDSKIYEFADSLTTMTPVTIWIGGRLGDWQAGGSLDGDIAQFPNGEHMVFCGYVAGTSYRRSSGMVGFVINIIHHLANLDMSSGGSRDVVPGSPESLLLAASSEGPGNNTFSVAATKFSATLPDAMTVDFSKAILDCLTYIAENNQIQTHIGSLDCGFLSSLVATPGFGGVNTRALRSILGAGDAYWNGIENATGAMGTRSKYAKPYPLEVSPIGREHVAAAVGHFLASSMVGASMWNMLVGLLLPQFGCALIPVSDRAFVAPILSSANEASIVIKPNDIVDIQGSSMARKPLYGVAVLSSYTLGTISDGPVQVCAGAAYAVPKNSGDDSELGSWMFVAAPRWCDGWTNLDPKASSGNPDVLNMMSTVSHDAVGTEAESVNRDIEEESLAIVRIQEKFAKLMYVSNSLRNRTCTIVTKLRFDIAPGITVKLPRSSPGSDQTSYGEDKLVTDTYGHVCRVTISIDAERNTAMTILELSEMRTAKENADPRYASESHPFFADYFRYAPLVEGLSLPPETE